MAGRRAISWRVGARVPITPNPAYEAGG